MKTRRARKTSGCLYMLGFMSGLLFVALCGSSAIYEELSSPLSESREDREPQPIVNVVASVPERADRALPEQETESLDIDLLQSDAGNELVIQGLGFEPDEHVVISIQAEEQEIATLEANTSGIGDFEVSFLLPEEYSALTSVKITAKGETLHLTTLYPLPGTMDIGQTATEPSSSELTAITATPTSEPGATAMCSVCTDTPTPSPTSTPTPVTPTPTITPTPSPTPVPLEPYYPNWRAEYFNNPSWTGKPAQMRDDPVISFDWGENSPAPGVIGQNWFSVRWTRRIALPEGYYTFVLSADDQAVVYMNGRQILSYIGKSASVNRASIYVPGPEPVEFEVRFAEFWGNAHIQFYWEPDDGHCCWHIEYYKGAKFSGGSLFGESVSGDDLRKFWFSESSEIWRHVDYNAPFSARVTRQLQSPGRRGNYHLCFYMQDSARLWLDGELLADHCECAGQGCLVCRTALLRKRPLHDLNLEYSHAMGIPMLGIWIVPKINQEPWIGAYFTNPDLAGLPLLVQTAAKVDFDWGDEAPEPRLPRDAFSVRWMRAAEFVKGHYRFHVIVDDGARLRINNRVVLDAWTRGSEREYIVDYDVLTDKETIDIELDYFEADEKAMVKLWWDTPASTCTPTPTATLTPSNTPSPTPAPTATPCCYTPHPCVTATPTPTI